MNEEALKLANLLEMCSQDGSIPSKDTLRKAADIIRELSELCDELSGIIGDEDDAAEVD